MKPDSTVWSSDFTHHYGDPLLAYYWDHPAFDDYPVVGVSWKSAREFTKWRSNFLNSYRAEKELHPFPDFRLPTEAEWEYASRGGLIDKRFSHGNELTHTNANFIGKGGADIWDHPSPVASFKPNNYGLFDVMGNVWEWCEDWYDPKGYEGVRETDPNGPGSAEARVHRGAGWSSSATRARSASRIGRHPSAYRGSYLGFRIVLEQSNNPRIERAADARLGKVFDYLVYDLGKGVELKLVKVSAKGQTFTIGSSAKEQVAVIQKYFHGKRPSTLDFEVEQRITLTDDFYIGRFEVSRGQFRRFVETTGYVTETETTDGGYGWNEDQKKFEGRDKKYSWKQFIRFKVQRFEVVKIKLNTSL